MPGYLARWFVNHFARQLVGRWLDGRWLVEDFSECRERNFVSFFQSFTFGASGFVPASTFSDARAGLVVCALKTVGFRVFAFCRASTVCTLSIALFVSSSSVDV